MIHLVFYVILIILQIIPMKTSCWENKTLLPSNFLELIQIDSIYSKSLNINQNRDKLIPKNLWISFRIIPPPSHMYYHLNDMFQSAQKSNWSIHLMDDSLIDEFMQTFYANTSILCAFELIDPKARVAASDLWRYAVLYAFGGLYMDDDSYFGSSLDDIIQVNDSLILGLEGSTYENCYREKYHLSNYNNELFGNEIFSYNSLFHSNSLLQWAIFAKPQHPTIYKILQDAVEVIRHEYEKTSVISSSVLKVECKVVLCSTGPLMFTASIREYLKMNNFQDKSIRIIANDFNEYGGVYKIKKFKPYLRNNNETSQHWSSVFSHHRVELLSSYLY